MFHIDTNDYINFAIYSDSFITRIECTANCSVTPEPCQITIHNESAEYGGAAFTLVPDRMDLHPEFSAALASVVYNGARLEPNATQQYRLLENGIELISTESHVETAIADMDDGGKITAIDAMEILKKYAERMAGLVCMN